MTLPLRFNPDVTREISEAYGYFLEKNEDAAEGFLTQLELTLERIQMSPNSQPRLDDRFRSAGVLKYHHRVVFSVEIDAIKIWTVFHTSRDPDELKRRLGY